MTRTADLALRSFYVLAGLGFFVYSLLESTSQMILYVPMVLGVLLVIQGISGA
ncbi:MAG TPA: hypothetical protein VLX32_14275 [Candidatus Acidoferrum sp.]|nr:hypothetical protein [Candidatus Acidoferrum sp.]